MWKEDPIDHIFAWKILCISNFPIAWVLKKRRKTIGHMSIWWKGNIKIKITKATLKTIKIAIRIQTKNGTQSLENIMFKNEPKTVSTPTFGLLLDLCGDGCCADGKVCRSVRRRFPLGLPEFCVVSGECLQHQGARVVPDTVAGGGGGGGGWVQRY